MPINNPSGWRPPDLWQLDQTSTTLIGLIRHALIEMGGDTQAAAERLDSPWNEGFMANAELAVLRAYIQLVVLHTAIPAPANPSPAPKKRRLPWS